MTIEPLLKFNRVPAITTESNKPAGQEVVIQLLHQQPIASDRIKHLQ